MNEEQNQYKQRAIQYWYIDGLADLTIGFFFLAAGLIFFGIASLSARTFLSLLFRLGMVLLIIGGAFSARRVLVALKERLTYPRTGYVSYPPVPRNRRILIAVTAIIVMILVSLIFAYQSEPQDLSALVDGSLLGILLILVGRGLLRFYLLSGFTFLVGVGLFLVGLQGYLAHSLFYVSVGLALLASGGLTLRTYLRQNQPVQEEMP